MRINPNTLGKYEVPEDAGGIALDVGANVGNWFSKHAEQFDLIHAYEPLLRCFDICCDKAASLPQVHVFQQAVSDKKKLVMMREHKRGTAGSSSVLGAPVSGWQSDWVSNLGRASAVPLETVIARTGSEEIGYLKIDVECSEYDILWGKYLRDIKYIGIELHCQLGALRWRQLVVWISETHRWKTEPVWKSKSHNEVLAVRR